MRARKTHPALVALSPLAAIAAFRALPAIILPLFLYVFASSYLAMSHASADAFSEPLDHTDALYFTITVLSTVGFGDITPKTTPARMVTGLQMLLALGFLAAVVRLLARAGRHGLSRDP